MSQQDITPFNPDAFKLSWELFTLDGYNGDLETYQALLNKNWDSDNIEDDAMIDPANLGIFYFNYQFLTQIEYLKGYKVFGYKFLSTANGNW